MELSPEDLERAEFSITNGGYDPEAVRELLRKAASRLRSLEREGVLSVSESVTAVLDQAVRSGEELIEAAKSDAGAIREAADVDAARIVADGEISAAASVTEGESVAAEMVVAAGTQVDEIHARAEQDARDRSVRVINEAQQRLDRLLGAERAVHDRLQAALTDIQASVSRVGVSQAAELALTVEDPADDVHWADEPAPAAEPAATDDDDRESD